MSSNKNVQQQLGMLKGLLDHGRLVLRLMSDKRVPMYLKALPIASLVYLISPIDFIPDQFAFRPRREPITRRQNRNAIDGWKC